MTQFTYFNYNDGGREAAGYKGKTGDCVCRAISIVTGLPYKDVYKRLAEGNATQRKSRKCVESKLKSGVKTVRHGISVNRAWFKTYMKELGFKWMSVNTFGGDKVRFEHNKLPMGKLIVSIRKHYAAVIDGVLNDTYDCTYYGTRIINGYWIYNN